MPITLAEIARLVGGELHGDGALEISGAAILRDCQAGEITFCDRATLLSQIDPSRTSAVLAAPGLAPHGVPYITVADAPAAFARVICRFRPPRLAGDQGVSPQALVAPTARLAAGIAIHAGASIGADVSLGAGVIVHGGARVLPGCQIGAGTTIFPNAVLYENTIVGQRCLIHAGAVLGAYGFGYETRGGRHVLSAQLGYVELEDDVEVGAGSTIDRGTYGPTRIGAGTKLDNQVMIAHNCRIGRHNLICSQVGVAGSVTTGDYVVLAGQAGLRDHIDVGAGAIVGARSGVKDNIPAGARVLGTPAVAEREQAVLYAAVSKLPETRRTIRQLERRLEELAARLAEREARDAPKAA